MTRLYFLLTLLAALTFLSLPRPTLALVPGDPAGFIAPGQPLPSEAQCAAQVQPRAEVVPANAGPNHVAANHQPSLTMQNDGYDARANTLAARVNGNFTGTTDELAQFYACKWGWSTDLLRAVMQQESSWQQSAVGDGGESFGITQVRVKYYPGTAGYAAQSTPFNLDVYLMFQRTCYEGYTIWLNDSHPGQYQKGDAYGCVGWWFRGDSWHDGDAVGYINGVQQHLSSRDWPAAQPAPSPSPSRTPTSTPTRVPSPSPSPVPPNGPFILVCPNGTYSVRLTSGNYEVGCR